MEFTKKNLRNKTYNLFSGKLLIIFRGATFRSEVFSDFIQTHCIKSFIKHVLKPIKKIHPDLDFSIEFLVYPHSKNQKLLEIVSRYSLASITNLSKNKDNQISTFTKCINNAIEQNVDGVLIIRPDLAFIEDLNPKNFCKSKILFQWNLLHDNISLEMADQIHFLGKNVLKPIYEYSLTRAIDEKWEGTLHNLLRFSMKILPKDKIGYMNYIKDPNPDRKNSRVEIRGNPTVDKGNPLYLYSSQIKQILLRSNLFYFLIYILIKNLKLLRRLIMRFLRHLNIGIN